MANAPCLNDFYAESDDGSDDEFHVKLDRALRDGYVEIFTAKCGVSGPPGQLGSIHVAK